MMQKYMTAEVTKCDLGETSIMKEIMDLALTVQV